MASGPLDLALERGEDAHGVGSVWRHLGPFWTPSRGYQGDYRQPNTIGESEVGPNGNILESVPQVDETEM